MSLVRDEVREVVRWAKGLACVLARLGGQLHRVDEAISAAMAGLADAIPRFDETRGDPQEPRIVKLERYARKRVVGEIREAIEAGRKADALVLGRGSALDDAEDPTPVEAVEGYVLACMAEELRSGGEAELLRHEAYERLRREITRLSPASRQLLALRFWEEQPWEDVAQALGMPEPTARDHWRKLRVRLRTALLAPTGLGGRVVPMSRLPRRRE